MLCSCLFLYPNRIYFKLINKSNTTLQGSEGALIDHQLIQSSFDRLANFLSQPGVTYNEINQIITNNLALMIQVMIGNSWQNLTIQGGYKICLRSTSLNEPIEESNYSSIKKLLDGQKPGIYVLQALPDKITPSSLPIRRIFCRPKPFC